MKQALVFFGLHFETAPGLFLFFFLSDKRRRGFGLLNLLGGILINVAAGMRRRGVSVVEEKQATQKTFFFLSRNAVLCSSRVLPWGFQLMMEPLRSRLHTRAIQFEMMIHGRKCTGISQRQGKGAAGVWVFNVEMACSEFRRSSAPSTNNG